MWRSPPDCAWSNLDAYCSLYNLERSHQSLDWQVSYEVHHATREKEKRGSGEEAGVKAGCVRLGARVE
jgi:hypothetical protein